MLFIKEDNVENVSECVTNDTFFILDVHGRPSRIFWNVRRMFERRPGRKSIILLKLSREDLPHRQTTIMSKLFQRLRQQAISLPLQEGLALCGIKESKVEHHRGLWRNIRDFGASKQKALL